MTLPPRIALAPMTGVTQFAPLVALGFFIRESDLLAPLYSRLTFTQATHTEYPVETLIEVWLSMLAGCRSVSQINTKIRPDLVLAEAWGRPGFAEQSTVARVLDGCQVDQVDQLREGVAAIYRWIGQAPQHQGATADLVADIDVTGLPAGRQAQGSTKGYFSGKKGPPAGNCAGLGPLLMMKVLPPCYILATPSVSRCYEKPSGPWKPPYNLARRSARMSVYS